MLTGPREYDVPYHMRVAIDNKILVGKWYTVRPTPRKLFIAERPVSSHALIYIYRLNLHFILLSEKWVLSYKSRARAYTHTHTHTHTHTP